MRDFQIKEATKKSQMPYNNKKTHNIQDTKRPALMEEIMKCGKMIMLENMKYQSEFIGPKTVIYVSQSWCQS